MVDSIPISRDAAGVLRVGESRVTLDLVVRAFQRGATAEEIVLDFPSLNLADVYQALGYYLKHEQELEPYFQSRQQEASALLAAHESEWAPLGLRARLLARRR